MSIVNTDFYLNQYLQKPRHNEFLKNDFFFVCRFQMMETHVPSFFVDFLKNHSSDSNKTLTKNILKCPANIEFF